MSWRAKFCARIQRTLEAYPVPDAAQAEALRRIYPLAPPWRDGPRYPYRVWRDEIARQTGQQVRRTFRSPRRMRCAHTLELFDAQRCPHTLDLFD